MLAKTVSLQSEVEILSGFAWKSSQFKEERCGLPIIRIQNVGTSGVGYVYWDGNYNDRFVVKKGDLLLTLSGSFRFAEWDGEDALLNQRIIKLNPSENLDRRFFLRYMQTQLEQIEHSGRHALVNNVSVSDIKKLPIPLPPLSEQKRIAKILDAADALRAKRRESLALLDDLTQSIFLDMFGDPVTNPKGWEVKMLGEVASFHAGSTLPPGDDFTGQSSGFLYLKVGDLNHPDNSTKVGTANLWAESAQKGITAPTNAVVIPKRGGAIGTNKKRLLTRPAVLDPNLMAISGNERQISHRYIFHWFHTFDLMSISSGSSVPQLNKKDLSPLKIQLPPLDLQQRFASTVESIEKQKERLKAQLSQMDTLFSSLQQRAFNGEL